MAKMLNAALPQHSARVCGGVVERDAPVAVNDESHSPPVRLVPVLPVIAGSG
jgi:hypothetical protein